MLFRRELFANVLKFIFPLLGGIMLAAVCVISAQESMNPKNGSGASIGGIGLVFYMGFGILLLGAALMVVRRLRRPEFFEGGTMAGLDSIPLGTDKSRSLSPTGD